MSTPQSTHRDSGPSQAVDVSHIPDAVPRWEPRTRAGNKSPYTVLGKTYEVMESSDGYRQRGSASWYGKKFHGAQTSNGEIYDMYGMTAAHKTLPIPTFVKVRNVANGKEVIVRVNDRGPFHGDRIIDLTYAAAKKLGFVEQGVATVEVEAINPDTWVTENRQPDPVVASGEPRAPAPLQSAGYQLPGNTFLQAGAFGSRESAAALQEKLLELTSLPVFIAPADSLQTMFRVRIGPIADNFELLNLKERIQQLNLGIPHVVRD
ncbi:septal ring lytic transglycosylase RlpA family protein [Gilvimarinus sp. F26214L]|uniref:septal ring lytic transglycosylase RlpA family protein n=1 Tax=Gilvimarinus sp. DZF01 TaxID=3461371 RepID=UPI0040463A63